MASFIVDAMGNVVRQSTPNFIVDAFGNVVNQSTSRELIPAIGGALQKFIPNASTVQKYIPNVTNKPINKGNVEIVSDVMEKAVDTGKEMTKSWAGKSKNLTRKLIFDPILKQWKWAVIPATIIGSIYGLNKLRGKEQPQPEQPEGTLPSSIGGGVGDYQNQYKAFEDLYNRANQLYANAISAGGNVQNVPMPQLAGYTPISYTPTQYQDNSMVNLIDSLQGVKTPEYRPQTFTPTEYKDTSYIDMINALQGLQTPQYQPVQMYNPATYTPSKFTAPTRQTSAQDQILNQQLAGINQQAMMNADTIRTIYNNLASRYQALVAGNEAYMSEIAPVVQGYAAQAAQQAQQIPGGVSESALGGAGFIGAGNIQGAGALNTAQLAADQAMAKFYQQQTGRNMSQAELEFSKQLLSEQQGAVSNALTSAAARAEAERQRQLEQEYEVAKLNYGAEQEAALQNFAAQQEAVRQNYAAQQEAQKMNYLSQKDLSDFYRNLAVQQQQTEAQRSYEAQRTADERNWEQLTNAEKINYANQKDLMDFYRALAVEQQKTASERGYTEQQLANQRNYEQMITAQKYNTETANALALQQYEAEVARQKAESERQQQILLQQGKALESQASRIMGLEPAQFQALMGQPQEFKQYATPYPISKNKINLGKGVDGKALLVTSNEANQKISLINSTFNAPEYLNPSTALPNWTEFYKNYVDNDPIMQKILQNQGYPTTAFEMTKKLLGR